MCRGDADLPGLRIDVKNARVLLPTNAKPLHYDLTLEPDLKVSHMRALLSSSTFNQASEINIGRYSSPVYGQRELR